MWTGHGWGMWVIWGLVMLLFWSAVIALAFFAIRAINRGGRDNRGTPGRPAALEALQERYARGEISREEYLEIRRDLET